ncbi:MAG: alpha-amylase family protein [Actinomycetota bacterium]|nr:alpha-amylase family protein [Actinomycetota bacterium]
MQDLLYMSREERSLFERAATVAQAELSSLPRRDQDIFLTRLGRYWRDLYSGLKPPYGSRDDFEDFLYRLVRRVAAAYAARPEELKLLDLERSLGAGWFQNEHRIGYVFYVDRFAGDLQGVKEHLGYLDELGVNYLHLMPLLEKRPGPDDGGYAVKDYRNVDPALGTMEDLEELCAVLRSRGKSVCLDLVLNHCAREHEWAVRARAGEQEYLEMFNTFPNRTIPDEYEKLLPEVLPETAPGNFMWDEDLERWVWTSFNGYQWDLNWSNSKVFLEMTDVMLYLANRGVEIFRLDAVAFIWKRSGTNCQNLPEAHDILQALRACTRIATPAVAHKAEAIVAPHDLIHYLGTHSRYGKESDLAYHNSLMVQFWSSLASRETPLMTNVLRKFPEKPSNTAWGTYIRGHDDIGWAITEEDAAEVGIDGAAHRLFLSHYYSGDFPGSHARGLVYELNPATGDRRISGSTGSLAGLEAALESGDERLIDLSIRRILLGHALIMGYSGVPLIYMGDELGLLNDLSYLEEPDKATDNRWTHRPPMDWEKALRREEPGTVEHRIFTGVRVLIEARKRTPHLHAATPTHVLEPYHPRIFSFVRPHPLGPLVAVYNFTEHEQYVSADLPRSQGIENPFDRITGSLIPITGNDLRLAPYEVLWLTDEP